MALTDIAARNAKPKDKPYKLYDSQGLYLNVTPAGGKVWRYKYKVDGKEKLLSIGKYPIISLKKAREIRDRAYLKRLEGIDPAQEKQEIIKANKLKKPTGKTFREVALLWAEHRSAPKTKRNWKPSYKKAVLRSLEREVFPIIGDRFINTLIDDDVDNVISPIENRGALETASKTLHRVSAIFRFGIFKKYCAINPALGRGEFLQSHEVKHMPHLEEQDLPQFLTDLNKYSGDFICKSALNFVLLTHARTNEVRFAVWDEIDFDSSLWCIPSERMKMGIAQTIPLSTQAIALLEQVKQVTGNKKYIFASLINMSKPISENGMLSVLYNMGYKGM